MHKTRYNALRLVLRISPVGPLLIKAGGCSADPSLPDMQFVRTYKAGKGEIIYIPGASVKGVIRGFIEKALRTINEEETWRWACATFENKNEKAQEQELDCSKRLRELKEKSKKDKKELESYEVYRGSCGACRLFGNTLLRGRIAFTDLIPMDEIRTEVRTSVAISRLSQAVAQGPFDMEVAVAGTFEGQIVLENYELWQLGVIATAMEAMNQGLLKVGFGKNRGFGQVQITVKEAQVEELAPVREETTLRGLADFVTGEESTRYGLAGLSILNSLPQPQKSSAFGFYRQRTYDGTGWQAISRQAIQALQ